MNYFKCASGFVRYIDQPSVIVLCCYQSVVVKVGTTLQGNWRMAYSRGGWMELRYRRLMAGQRRGETKWEINKTEGCGAVGCRYAGSFQPSLSLVQPFDRNFVPHWKTRAVCFHATNNSTESKKSDGCGGRGDDIFLYVCCVTLGGSSAPLCGSYLLYSHYLSSVGEGSYCCFCVPYEVIPSFHLSSLCTVQFVCCVYCWEPNYAAAFV